MKIPKRIFQATALLLLVPTFALVAYDASHDSGIYTALREILGQGPFGRLLSFIAMLLAYVLSWAAVAMLLRKLSDMPSFSQELSGMEGKTIVEKFMNSYRAESSRLDKWKSEGNVRYASRMALAAFAVSASLFIALAVVVFLFDWRYLVEIAQFKIGLVVILTPVIALILGVYYCFRAMTARR